MNTFYHGDCLFVLRHDIPKESVDLIYLDPPFFTGKVQKGTKKWQPGAMELSFEDSKRFWSEKADEMREKSPAWLRHIAIKRPDFASYVWYMMERLDACHKVLKKTGSIYLHCDYRASHYLKMVMDEIFGDDKFRNEIVWHYTSGGVSKRKFAKKHDILFFYSKSAQYYFEQQKYKRFLDKSKGYDPRIEYFKDEESGRDYRVNIMPDVWTDIGIISPNSFERFGYPTQKPEALLERIIKASSNEGDLVLDPFCGCGTAVIVASKLNRRFIGIDIHPTAFEVIKNRGHELFAESRYISRDLDEVLTIDPRQFEGLVNEYYKATKPHPDRGVDGITHEGIPIQVKTFQIKYDTIDKLLSSSKFHPLVPKPIKKLIFVSQVGFDDGARKREFEIETAEGIEVDLVAPKEMLSLT